MRSTLRMLAVTATLLAALGVGAASASAVSVQENGVTCGPLSGGPAGSGNPFTGGCDFSAHADSMVMASGGSTIDCALDIPDARVSGDGEIGINAIVVTQGTTANCDLFEPCLDPALPWAASVGGIPGGFATTIEFCFDFPFFGTLAGPTTGEWRNASGNTPPQIEFDNAPIGSSGATYDGILDISPATLHVS